MKMVVSGCPLVCLACVFEPELDVTPGCINMLSWAGDRLVAGQ